MISCGDLERILAFGSEQRGVEFKASGSLNNPHFLARVVRALLGMANRRDGGLVVLGVDDNDPSNSSGMATDLVAEWTHYDNVADQVDRYADPGVEFSVDAVTCEGRLFVAIQVDEFLEQPIICQKSYQPDRGKSVLRRGAVYVRASTGKVETREPLDASEMREVLDLATEKRLRSHIETTARAGGMIVASDGTEVLSDAQHFTVELGDLA